jgi:hypothetical protein
MLWIPGLILIWRDAAFDSRAGYFCGVEFLIVRDIQREGIKLACEGLPIKHPHLDPRDPFKRSEARVLDSF